ncbi:MAG: Fur family transcriptional regulator [Bacteroidales bacterium]
MNHTDYKILLREHGLKVTPQRMAVLEAVEVLQDHPTADEVGSFIRKSYPNIATGTVYKTLETLVDKKMIIRVKTDRGILRYDAVREVHHHLYSAESDRIEDYYDADLTRIINRYFKKKKIPNFRIDDIKLQIMGSFTGKTKRNINRSTTDNR